MNLLLNTALGALALLGLAKAVTASRRAKRAERQLTWAIDRSNRYFFEATAARRQACEAHADPARGQREAAHFDAVPNNQPLQLPADIAADLDQWLDDLLRRKER